MTEQTSDAINVIVHCVVIIFISSFVFCVRNNIFSSPRDSDSEDSGDRPVQGPMPYEPEDAPWKKSEVSGIRKL